MFDLEQAAAHVAREIGVILADLVETERTGEAKHELRLLTDKVHEMPFPTEKRERILAGLEAARNHLVHNAVLGIGAAVDQLREVSLLLRSRT